MKKKKNVILIGFMGCGKTTVGLKLSYRLKLPVEDTDKLIEQKHQKSISEMFEDEGEEYFRQEETELLKEIRDRSYRRIISVGGGTPIREENRRLLKECGTVIYLRVSPQTVYERLKNDMSRPLLKCSNPREKIKELMDERKKAYEDCADMIIDADGKNAEELLQEISEGLRKRTNGKKNGMKLLVINGPNLNFLGIRERHLYGTRDYQYLLKMLEDKAKESGNEIKVFQSNHEGEIIDRIQEAYFDHTQGIVINPGAYTHYSYAIRDALASITVPKVEVHITDITDREEFRKISVTAPVCHKQIYGQGLEGYLQAIDFITDSSHC